MKRSAPILFLLALIILAACGCGSSGSDDPPTPDYSGFYSIREPDSGGGPTKLLRYSAGGVTTVATMDFSSLTTTSYPDFAFYSTGSAFDPAGMAIYGIARISGTGGGKSIVFKLDVRNGSVAGFAENASLRFTDLVLYSSNAYVISTDTANGSEAVTCYPLTGAVPSAPAALAVDALYPGYSVDIVPAAATLDGSSGKVFLLLRRVLAGPEEFSIVRADLTTGALETPIELGSTYFLGNLFLNGTDLYMTGEDSSGSSKILKVPAAGGTLSLVSTLDFTPVIDAMHTVVHVATYTKALDQGGSVLLLPLRTPDNTSGEDLNVLVAVNTATGAMAKLDTVVGCYYMNTFVP